MSAVRTKSLLSGTLSSAFFSSLAFALLAGFGSEGTILAAALAGLLDEADVAALGVVVVVVVVAVVGFGAGALKLTLGFYTRSTYDEPINREMRLSRWAYQQVRHIGGGVDDHEGQTERTHIPGLRADDLCKNTQE